MSVEFHDFSDEVKAALESAVNQWLEDSANELEAQTKRRTRVGEFEGFDVKGSWNHVVDESRKEAKIGSPLEAAFWEEFGTGEHALNKDGRKGWWVYFEGGSGYKGPTNHYSSREEAESMAAFISKKHGVHAVATNGTKPNRPLFNAYTENKGKITRRAEQIFKERLK